VLDGTYLPLGVGQHGPVDLALFFLALLVVSLVVYPLEAAWGRNKLKNHLSRQGWTVRSAQWQPRWPIRQARFRVDAERTGERATGTALVGGEWTGPVFSRFIDVEWDPR
jgi:hypothetical protein